MGRERLKRVSRKRAQTMLEYAIMIAAIIIAVLAVAGAIRKALQKKGEEAARIIEETPLERPEID